MGLDLSFLSWDLLTKFILKGFAFSVQLTVVATLGGIALGTVLALMRLSGRKLLALPATAYVNGMRSVPLVMVILWRHISVRSCVPAFSPFRAGRSWLGKPWA
jgi:glutamate/aspartate transport system permease protein